MYGELFFQSFWFTNCPNWIVLLLAILPLIYWYSTRNFNYWSKHSITSPPTTPFIGNFISLTTPLPILFQRYLKQFGSLFGVYLGQKPILVISEPELIKRILVKDFHMFRNRTGIPRHQLIKLNLISVRDEEWKRIRSILTPMFTSAKLKKMESLMLTCVDTMINSFESLSQSINSNSINARDQMDNFTMNVIGKCAFATDTIQAQNKQNVFIQMAKKFLSFNLKKFILISLTPSFVLKKMVQWKVEPYYLPEIGFFEDLTRHLVQERKKASGNYNDMLQLMINAEHSVDSLQQALQADLHEDDHIANSGNEEIERKQQELREIIGLKYLSEEEIMAQVVVFLLAGYETTASTLSYCLYELAINPDIQERLYHEIQSVKTNDPNLNYSFLSKLDYLDAVLSETLRKYPPVWILNRESNEQYLIAEHNVTLEKKQEVIVPVYAIHHSEKYFPEPEKFNPDRFMPQNRDKIEPYTYLPFGCGPRNCIGMRFALTEAKMGLAQIVDRFQVVRTDKTGDKLKIMKGFFLLKTSSIYIGIRKRN